MKWKLWLNLITFAALGLIIFFAWRDIVEAFVHMAELNVWILLLLIPAQFIVYGALAKFFFYFFRAAGVQISIKQLFAPMLELNFVNHIFPSGGVSGISYFALRLKGLGVSTAKSTLSQLARFAFSFIGFIALMLLALVLLAIEGHTSSVMVLVVSALTFTILFGTAVLFYVIGSEKRIASFTRFLAKILNKIVHFFHRKKPEIIDLSRVEETFLELHEDYKLLRSHPHKLRRVMFWAMAVNLAELLLLYIVFVAHGEWINPGAIIVAFTIANIAGLIAILPGGVGVFEPLMTGVLISAGVSPPLALSATLVYRVATLLLSLGSGYFFYHKAVKQYGTTNFSSQRTNKRR